MLTAFVNGALWNGFIITITTVTFTHPYLILSYPILSVSEQGNFGDVNWLGGLWLSLGGKPSQAFTLRKDSERTIYFCGAQDYLFAVPHDSPPLLLLI